MIAEWLFYPAAFFLLVANLIAWSGNFYRLHGNWVIVSNTLLFLCLFPTTESGTGISWFALFLIISLAVLGDSFYYASKRHHIFSSQGPSPIRQRVMVGAGIGSLTCVIAGMSVPIIGPLLAVIGAVGGAAGGAWLGTILSPRNAVARLDLDKAELRSERLSAESIFSRFLNESQIRLIPKLLAGLIMILVVTYTSFF